MKRMHFHLNWIPKTTIRTLCHLSEGRCTMCCLHPLLRTPKMQAALESCSPHLPILYLACGPNTHVPMHHTSLLFHLVGKHMRATQSESICNHPFWYWITLTFRTDGNTNSHYSIKYWYWFVLNICNSVATLHLGRYSISQIFI